MKVGSSELQGSGLEEIHDLVVREDTRVGDERNVEKNVNLVQLLRIQFYKRSELRLLHWIHLLSCTDLSETDICPPILKFLTDKEHAKVFGGGGYQNRGRSVSVFVLRNISPILELTLSQTLLQAQS